MRTHSHSHAVYLIDDVSFIDGEVIPKEGARYMIYRSRKSATALIQALEYLGINAICVQVQDDDLY